MAATGASRTPQFAPSGDAQIAYLLDDGDGPVVAVLTGTIAGTTTAHEPLFQSNFDRWRRFARLLLIDARGSGQSDPIPPGIPPTVDDQVTDLIAVLDHAGLDKVWLYGYHGGGAVGIAGAVHHPDRVHGLLIVNGWARLLRDDDMPWGISQRFSDQLIEEHGRQYGTGMFLQIAAPSRLGDPEVERLMIALERGSSRAQATLLTTMLQELDVRSFLPRITVPTMVVHVRDNQMIPVEHGRHLANHIPEVRYVEVEGTDHAYQLQTNDEVMDELEAFVTGARPQPRADRVFAAVLFTDIVGSTERASREGDRRWRHLLDAHDRATNDVVLRHGGRLVKHTGDGVLAIFDAPSRALRAGLELCARLGADGLPVRAGVHAGEIEQRGDDVSGIAVHLAQRVCGQAAEGELLASRSVPDLVLGQPFTFADAGEHTLKGTPGQWRLFRVGS